MNESINAKQSARDLKTLEAIGRIFCNAHHPDADRDEAGLCPACRNTIDATFARTATCPNHQRSNCEDCAVKCQRGDAQARIKEIMRYSAPRMLFRHPLMTLEYLRKKR